MLRVYLDGEQITYTAGDTFLLNISADRAFDDGSRLRAQIAENENSKPLIEKLVELDGGFFELLLSDEETEKLPVGNYIYKLTVIGTDGRTVTRKSGELIVKWGA